MHFDFKARYIVSAILVLGLLSSLFWINYTESRDESVYQNIYTGDDRQWQPENISAVKEHAERTGDPNVMVEVSSYPNSSPTQEQLENAWNLYNRSFEMAEKKGWFNKSKGLDDGYFNWYGDTFHYPHRNYTRERQTLRPSKPEFLMYYNSSEDSGESILAGIMFQTSSLEEEGHQIAGPITTWHYHYHDPEVCLEYWGPVSNTKVEPVGECPDGTDRARKTFEMLHVWFVDHPDSQFSSDMVVSQETLDEGIEKLNRSEFISKHSQK